MKSIRDLRVPCDSDRDIESIVTDHLGIRSDEIGEIKIVRKSLDARRRGKFTWVYTINVLMKGESAQPAIAPFPKLSWKGQPPVIIGSGPAGIFAALTFIEHGIRPIVVERGARASERIRKIARYWRYGELDTESNVCFGEGGAGTFSDGKLMTRIKSPHIARVLNTMVQYGAPPEIQYVSDPHIGSNRLRGVISRMNDDRADLRFNTLVESLAIEGRDISGVTLADGSRIESSGVLLACGHSARELLKNIHAQGIKCEAKPLAIGLRIEHSQSYLNKWQYGNVADAGLLGPAQYKLAHHWHDEGIGVYTFCMCPGGYIISSSTERDRIVINGMSNYQRNSGWGNSAIVCTVPEDRIEGADPFKMMRFQEEIEHRTFLMSKEVGDGKQIPAQRLDDFIADRRGSVDLKSSTPSGVCSANIAGFLPDSIYEYLREGIMEIDRKRRGFAHPDAVLHAIESRTSSAVRVPRDSVTMEAVEFNGLFPCGEGPGYAGGITSAAVDGINSALAWITKFKPASA